MLGKGGELVWWEGVIGGTWQGGGEAAMGNGARGESGFDGMSSGSGLGPGRRGFGSEGGW